MPALPAPEIASRLAAFDDIEVVHPRMSMLMQAVGDLAADTACRIVRNDHLVSAAMGRPVKLEELWMLPLIGPSGAGKSFSIRKIVKAGYEDAEQDTDIPILPVTLRSSTRSPRQLQHQILEAYGDPQAQLVLRERDFSEARASALIRDIARHRKTTIIVLDEAHNLLAHGGYRVPMVMAKAIKSLVNDGLFSVVLSGTEDLLELTQCDAELRSRQREVIDFSKLRPTAEDVRYFLNFAAYLENTMIKEHIIDAPIGLTSSVENCATLFDMADGIIGIVSRLVRLALRRGLSKKDPSVDWLDLLRAHNDWRQSKGEMSGRESTTANAVARDKTLKVVADALKPQLPVAA